MIPSSIFKDYLLRWSLEKTSGRPQHFLIDVNILFASIFRTGIRVCLQHLAENCQECQEARGFHSGRGGGQCDVRVLRLTPPPTNWRTCFPKVSSILSFELIVWFGGNSRFADSCKRYHGDSTHTLPSWPWGQFLYCRPHRNWASDVGRATVMPTGPFVSPRTVTQTSLPCGPPLSSLATTHLFSVSIIVPFHECCVNGIAEFVAFLDWLFALGIAGGSCALFQVSGVRCSALPGRNRGGDVSQFVLLFNSPRTSGLCVVWGY